MINEFSRTELLLGADGMKKLNGNDLQLVMQLIERLNTK